MSYFRIPILRFIIGSFIFLGTHFDFIFDFLYVVGSIGHSDAIGIVGKLIDFLSVFNSGLVGGERFMLTFGFQFQFSRANGVDFVFVRKSEWLEIGRFKTFGRSFD